MYPRSALFASAVVLPTVLAGLIQLPGLTLPSDAAANQESVKQIFNISYTNYKKFAWGHDSLTPLTASYVDDYGGYGATIVDALDTMYLMGFDDWFAEAVNFSSTIDFNQMNTPNAVSVFESTIRYLGGLLSAYELSGEQYPALLSKAQEIADNMAYAWVGDNPLPYNEMNFTTNSPVIEATNIAQAGTLTLEWATLSKYTGNQTYGDLATKAVEYIANLPPPLPGLAAQGIDPTSSQFVGGYVSWGGGSDSYFEYLIKYPRLTNTPNNLYADTWNTALDSSLNTLKQISTVGNWTYFADYNEGQIIYVGSHLECYAAGNFIMGGKLLNNDTIVNAGLAFADACWNTYAGDATGIGPEVFAYISPDGDYNGGAPPTAEQLAFYNEHGFYITVSDYIMRPEVLESNFYAWRSTGDIKYYNRAISAVNSFNEYLSVPNGYAGINDVNNVTSTKIDETESFWFAEVLKYLYLTFDDPSNISLDEYVFNTECHPYKAPPALPVYGSNTILHYSEPFSFKSGPPLPVISPVPYLPPITNPQ